MRARDVMVSPAITVTKNASLRDVARILLEKRISAVPVVDDGGKVIGIVTEGDLIHRAEAGTERHDPWWLRFLTDDATFAAIYQAWLDHAVVLFRDQRLSDGGLIAFSRRFGTLDQAPIQENGRRFVEGLPEIYVVSNVVENGVAIGSLGAGEAVWHTDMSYLPDPPKASALYALEVPSSGGDTSSSPPLLRCICHPPCKASWLPASTGSQLQRKTSCRPWR